MEKQKQGSSSSSFATDLFGPEGSSKPSNSSPFGSIFDTPIPAMSTLCPRSGNGPPSQDHSREWKRGEPMKSNQHPEKEKSEPSCYYNSSILYGGREVYPTADPSHTNKKDGEGNSSGCTSRGNWWRGSLYY